MSNHKPSGTPIPQKPRQGIFLPTLVWTTDRQEVEDEIHRLARWHVQLHALVSLAFESDIGATWFAMADSSLIQLTQDIEDLYAWLQDADGEAATHH